MLLPPQPPQPSLPQPPLPAFSGGEAVGGGQDQGLQQPVPPVPTMVAQQPELGAMQGLEAGPGLLGVQGAGLVVAAPPPPPPPPPTAGDAMGSAGGEVDDGLDLLMDDSFLKAAVDAAEAQAQQLQQEAEAGAGARAAVPQ